MFKFFYYVYRNLVYYRKERQIKHSRMMDVAMSNDTKRTMTNAFLASVGLKVVDDECDRVPRYIPLSKIQKSWAKTASEYGYKVGLT